MNPKRKGEPEPRHWLHGCGCFLPDLTRLAATPCGEARQHEFYTEVTQEVFPLCSNHAAFVAAKTEQALSLGKKPNIFNNLQPENRKKSVRRCKQSNGG
jgi:hypothetical protein